MFKQNKALFLLFLFLQQSNACGNGCLKCSLEEICEICDTQNGFFLKEQKCDHNPIEKCTHYNLEGKCLQCKELHYLTDQNSCSFVEGKAKVENCLFYSQNGLCLVCENDNYLLGGKCQPAELVIDFCQIYDSKSTCLECFHGHLISLDKKICRKVSPVDQCVSYSLNKCTQCNDNSITDFSYDFEQLEARAKELTSNNQQFVFDYFNGKWRFYHEFCITTKVANCQDFEDYKTCKECKKGFYLENNQCKANPMNFINKCEKYTNLSECMECVQGFFLKSVTECVKVVAVTNCLKFSKKDAISKCSQCEDGFFLESFNECKPRTKTIDGCSVYEITTDKCNVCSTGQRITDDGLKCLTTLEFCTTYSSSTVSSNGLNCTLCKSGYYINNNICVLGTKENCKVFLTTSDSCAECINKYYLQAGSCLPHDDISNCQDYSKTSNNLCSKCVTGTALFNKYTNCKQVVEVEGCLLYSAFDSCQQCKLGYNRASSTECQIIEATSSCNYKELGTCTICKEGYYLENQQCLSPITIAHKYCDSPELQTNGDFPCSICQENSIPYDYASQQVCISNESFNSIKGSYNQVVDCEVYQYIGINQMKCVRCKSGLYLNQSNDTCVSTCSTTVTRFKTEQADTIQITYSNVCNSSDNDATCSTKVMGVEGGNFLSECTDCQTTYFDVVNWTDSSLNVFSQDISGSAETDQTYSIPKRTCVDKTGKVQNPSSGLDNCEYYYHFSEKDEYGCLKCKHQHNGLIKNWGVENCMVFNETNKVCQQCTNKYKLINGYTCEQLPDISDCKWYWYDVNNPSTTECQVCEENFYLSNSTTCSAISPMVVNCQNYYVNINKCAECKTGYILSNNTSFCIEKKSRCITYADVNNETDSVICLACETGYYPANGGSQCVKGNVDYCWKYKQNMTNKCESYLNYIKFNNTKKCTQVTDLDGCITYSNKTQCDTCDTTTHYKSGDICCDHRKVNQNGKCMDIKINNCKESNGLEDCNQCLDNFYPDNYQTELTPPHKCCGEGTYFHPSQLLCSSLVDVSLNTINCLVWNYDVRQCIACTGDNYVSNSATGFCCPEGKYHVVVKDENTCGDIDPVSSNCLKYDNTASNCTKCNTGFTLSNGICCDSTSQFESSGVCTANLRGCVEMNTNGTKCDKCDTDYFLADQIQATGPVTEPSICCKYKNNNDVFEWFETGSACNTTAHPLVIAECILFRYDATSALQRCEECKTGFQVSKNGKHCCPTGQTHNGTLCIPTQHFSQNCIAFDSSDIFQCTVCDTGYYLYKGQCPQLTKFYDSDAFDFVDITISNCSKVDTDLACIACLDTHTLTDGACVLKAAIITNSVAVPYQDYYANCAFAKFADKECITCMGLSYKESGSKVCCELGKKAVNNECVDIGVVNCKKFEGGSCTMYEGSTIDNCEQTNDQTTCTQCADNYVVVEGLCKSLIDIQSSCLSSEINHNCITSDPTACTCQSCKSWAYGDHCCDYGKRWDSTIKRCIENDDLCAKQTEDNKCDECFFHDKTMTVVSEYKYKFKSVANSVTADEDVTLPTGLEYVYISNETNTSKKCCSLGNYYNDTTKSCNQITISDCDKSNDNQTCDQCAMNYKKVNNDNNCCLYTEQWDVTTTACINDTGISGCQANYYLSNLNCCPEHYYYNVEVSQCMPLLDINCLKSDNNYTCDGECMTDYQLVTIPTNVELDIPFRPHAVSYSEKLNVLRCQLTADQTGLTDFLTIKNLSKNCSAEDFSNNQCTTCQSGSYMVGTFKFCCEEGYAHYDDSVNKYCTQISNVQDDCLSYDPVNKKCLNCTDNTILSYGRCCAKDTYLSIFQDKYTATCDLILPNCMILSETVDMCKICNDGYTKSKGKCVDTGKYWNSTSNTEEDIATDFPNCISMDDKDMCTESDTLSYISNGHACVFGLYYNGTECVNISGMGEGFSTCTMLNKNGICTKCSSTQLTNGRCCDYKEYWEPYTRKCQSIFQYQFCNQATFDKSTPCKECMDGYYLSFDDENNRICAIEGKVVIDKYGTQIDIQDTNCLRAYTYETCFKCIGDKIVHQNQCMEYQEIPNANERIGECKVIEVIGNTKKCKLCESNHYLTNSEQTCCPIGSYFNGITCVSLETVSLNCGQYENNKCEECMMVDNLMTYLSNESACCKEGEYAVNATLCSSINPSFNCQQTDNHTVCNKCNPDFKLVAGQCKTNTITNCSIGDNDVDCLICKTGYYLDTTTKQCVVQTQFSNCQTLGVNVDECLLCDNNYYFDGKQCCSLGQYYRITGVVAPTCQVLVVTSITDCQEMENGKCVGCGSGKYLTQDNCCTLGQFYNGTACVTPTGDGLDNCNYFTSLTECEQKIINTEDNSCQSSFYFHEGHCCATEQHWDGSKCELNTAVTSYKNCKKIVGGECTECASTAYLSNGLCCIATEYNENGTCITIPVANCDQYDGTFCLQGTGANLVVSHGRCCTGQYYDFSASPSVCTAVDASWGDYNIYESKLISCAVPATHYPATDLICCGIGQFYDTVTNVAIPACANFTVDINCERGKRGNNIDNTTCLECAANFTNYYEEGCVDSTTEISFKLGGAVIQVDKATIQTDCLTMGSDGECTSCVAGKNFNEKQCCDVQNVSDTNFDCVTFVVAGISDCAEGSYTACSKCDDGFFALTDQSKCCIAGKVSDGITCDGTTTGVTNCILYSDTAKMNKCQTCAEGTTLYVNPDNVDITLCCGQKLINTVNYPQVPDFTLGACVINAVEIANCKNFDTFNNKCLDCNDDKYLSSNDVCCSLDNFYDNRETEALCKVNADTNCSKFTTKCDECKTGFYYNDTTCCQESNYVTALGTCAVTLATADYDGCKKVDGAAEDKNCSECEDDYNLSKYYNGATLKQLCCKDNKYVANGAAPDCTTDTTITNCKIQHTDLGPSQRCDECNDGYKVITNKNATSADVCCKHNEFAIYNTTTLECKTKWKLDSDCLTWDRKNMKCTSCVTTKHLSGGRCCAEGDYSTSSMDSCDSIAVPAGANKQCLQYNDVDGCTKCDTDSILKRTLSSDVQNCCIEATDVNGYLGCETFTDSLDKCLTCKTGYYLHKDRCVTDTNRRDSDNNNFESIDFGLAAGISLNCKRVQQDTVVASDNVCIMCIDDYYLVDDNKRCCQEGKYWNGTICKDDGAVENCLNYEDSQTLCKKCKQSYLLAVLKDGQHRCMGYAQQNTELCLETSVFEENGENKFQCTLCKEQNTKYVIESDSSDRIVPYNALPSCQYYDTQTTLSVSSLKCLQCYKNELNFLKTENNKDVCTLRKTPTNCTSYSISSDDCLTCEVGYHIVTSLIDTQNLKRCEKNTLNCKIYDIATSKCHVCDDNYVISLINNVITCVINTTFEESQAKNPSFFPGYIQTCEADDTCSNKFVGGLSSYLNKIFSCHVCSNSDLIPFVSFKGNNGTANGFFGLQRYKRPTLVTDKQDMDAELKSSSCLRPVGDTFNISAQNFNFPSNCSLGLINSGLTSLAGESSLQTPNVTNLGVFCVSCKPGFEPLYSTASVYKHVYKCQQISNCAVNGENFNECEKCQTNYVFQYANNSVNRSKCIEFVLDENCLAFDSTTNKCKYCNPKYSFNYDNKCEMIVGPNSSEMDFVKTFPQKEEYPEIKRRYTTGFGSRQCDNDHVLVINQQYNKVCTFSPFVEKKMVMAESQFYEENCVKYSASDLTLKCVECNMDSVLDQFGKCLVITDDIRHCQVAQNTQKCIQCKTNYVLIEDKCILTDIDNCVTYLENSKSNSIKCSQCDENYGLQNNVCIKDLFNSCLRINDSDMCEMCQQGYQLTTLKEDRKICINVSTHQNCHNYITTDFQQYNMKCNQCESNKYFLETLTSPVQVCNQYINIKHCQSYDISTTFNDSTLQCSDCKEGYYLLSNQCFIRTVKISNCSSYEPTSQLCKQCIDDFFLGGDKKQCIQTPKGVSNCRIYESNLVCKECESHYYLSGGDCMQVDADKIVQLCYTYDDTQGCSKCHSNYLFQENKCNPIVASNCLEISSPTACKTCSFGFQLKENEGGVTSCEKIEKPNILKCLTVSDSIPFKCEICETKFYAEGGQCIAVENPIDNCKQYQTPFICDKCDNYHILSEDKSFCKPLPNQNCLTFQEQKETFCVICGPGYQLVEGVCKKMNSIKENCLLYENNTVEEVQTLKCVMCLPGNSMDKSGECKQTLISNSSDNSDDKTEEEEKEKNSGFLNALSMVFQFFMFINYF